MGVVFVSFFPTWCPHYYDSMCSLMLSVYSAPDSTQRTAVSNQDCLELLCSYTRSDLHCIRHSCVSQEPGSQGSICLRRRLRDGSLVNIHKIPDVIFTLQMGRSERGESYCYYILASVLVLTQRADQII